RSERWLARAQRGQLRRAADDPQDATRAPYRAPVRSQDRRRRRRASLRAAASLARRAGTNAVPARARRYWSGAPVKGTPRTLTFPAPGWLKARFAMYRPCSWKIGLAGKSIASLPVPA